MRQLKNLTWMQGNIGLSAISEFGIPLCCVDFFWNVQSSLRSTIPEYANQQYAHDNGVIECPECLIRRLSQ